MIVIHNVRSILFYEMTQKRLIFFFFFFYFKTINAGNLLSQIMELILHEAGGSRRSCNLYIAGANTRDDFAICNLRYRGTAHGAESNNGGTPDASHNETRDQLNNAARVPAAHFHLESSAWFIHRVYVIFYSQLYFHPVAGGGSPPATRQQPTGYSSVLNSRQRPVRDRASSRREAMKTRRWSKRNDRIFATMLDRMCTTKWQRVFMTRRKKKRRKRMKLCTQTCILHCSDKFVTYVICNM